jgi:hypothetical protein
MSTAMMAERIRKQGKGQVELVKRENLGVGG